MAAAGDGGHGPNAPDKGTLLEAAVLEEKPKGWPFWLIMISLWLVTFLICLDVSIVAPAIPVITNQFHSTSKATWFFSVYLALNTAFQPTFGPFLKLAPKWTFLVCLVFFEIGSLVCALAGSAGLFIFGRALAGVSSAGCYIGILSILAVITEPHETARFGNAMGGIYSIGAVCGALALGWSAGGAQLILGPLIGGAFTSKVTGMSVNLPLGGVALVACFFFLSQPKRKDFEQDFKTAVRDTDWLGLLLVIGGLMMLLMVFQWGGIEHAWSSSVIIGLLVGVAVIAIVVVGWCIYRDERDLRPRLVKMPIIWTGALHGFGIASLYFTVISLLTFYYQIRGSSPLRSGVQLLPMITGVVTALFVGGAIAPKIGYVNPLLIAGEVFFVVGAGCFVLFDQYTSTAMWAGVTFLAGFGDGLCYMMPFVGAQALLEEGDREIGTAHVVFPQTLGGAIAFGISQAIYQNKYATAVSSIPGLPNPEAVANGGITAFFKLAPAEFILKIQDIAIKALRNAYYAPIAVLALVILVNPFTPWPSIKPVSDASDAVKQEATKEQMA